MEREHALDALKAAFADGRLTKEEFELRVAQALAAYSELDSLTADIPGVPAVRRPVLEYPDPRHLIRRGTAWGTGASVALASTVLLLRIGVVAAVIGGAVVAVVMSLLLAGFLTLQAWAMERGTGTRATPSGPAGQTPPVRPIEPRRRPSREPRRGAQASRVAPATA
jgi:hypothetical protein